MVDINARGHQQWTAIFFAASNGTNPTLVGRTWAAFESSQSAAHARSIEEAEASFGLNCVQLRYDPRISVLGEAQR
ncbi:hypothetical protein N7494_000566 [Penicillium frequentans]|uniref:Uncharacterized protein n=1 Tax=Penicillium frequentans TaxID=3151616 RepID=A0AAD6GJY4_9EURO|nr:hypothetical protein N7494_000566 [Penicillium glabrum]